MSTSYFQRRVILRLQVDTMSIINKVLQEIDKTRKTTNVAAPHNELELGTAFNKYKNKLFNRFTVVITLIVICALLLLEISQSTAKKHNNSKITTPPFLTSNNSSATTHINVYDTTIHNGAQQQTTKPAFTTTPQATLPTTLLNKSKDDTTVTHLGNIELNVEQSKTIVGFILSRETYYYVEHGKDQLQLKIILGNTTYEKEPLPLNFLHTAIKKMHVYKENANTNIELELLPDTQVIGLQIYNQPQTRLQLILLNTNTPVGTVAKTTAVLTPQQRATQNYQEALEFLNQNQPDLAINKLRDIIDLPRRGQDQDNTKDIYDLLASLLIDRHDFNGASKVLSKALKIFPQYARFEQLQAYVMAHKGSSAEALELLLQHPPEITQDPGYYAFIASLYQQQEQFILAAQLYNRLLKIQPNNAMWWLGLGVALDSMNKQNAAKEAYRRAFIIGNLPTQVHNFISNKLGGQ